MRATEAKQYADKHKNISEKEELQLAIIEVDNMIKEQCEHNEYEMCIYESESWRIKKHLEAVVKHFQDLGYNIMTHSYINGYESGEVMLYIDWECPE